MKKIKETIMAIYIATKYSFSFCLRNKKRVTIARVLLEVVNTLFFYFTIQITGKVVNAVQSNIGVYKNISNNLIEFIQSNLFYLIIIMFGIMIAGMISGELSRYFRKIWFQYLNYANKQELNDHIATLDVARFRSKEYDDLSKRIQELPSSWETRIYFSEAMLGLFTTIISFVIFGASLILYEPIYAIILLLTAIPVSVAEFSLVSRWWKLFQDLVPKHKKRYVLQKPYRDVNSFVQALMFNQMPSLRKQIMENTDSIIDEYENIRRLTLKKSILNRLISISGLSLVILYLVWVLSTKGGDVGTFTIIIAAARTFQSNVSSIVSVIADQWNNAKGVILIEKDFLSLKPIVKTNYPVIPNYNLVPTIKFENVSFAYPDTEKLVLRNVSFTIKPGTKVAIVGKSGNGKSTIQSLLMRIYDPVSGSIYAEGVNLKNIEPRAWNNIASSLTQEYSIMSRTVGEEISSSKPDQPSDMASIISSSHFANFDDVINFDSKGYDSQIGIEFGGRDFSGGERQRLALARVRYKGTPILILDEPDAKLDPESASQVMDQIFALEGVTVIIITHHVSRAEKCDNIIVMGKGEVAEQGTHSELILKKGMYASLYSKDKERIGSISE